MVYREKGKLIFTLTVSLSLLVMALSGEVIKIYSSDNPETSDSGNSWSDKKWLRNEKKDALDSKYGALSHFNGIFVKA